MASNGSKLTPKQEEAILALLTNQGVDNAARAVGIGPRTLYRWMNGYQAKFKISFARSYQR